MVVAKEVVNIARTDTLNNCFTDIANAIRNKTGDTSDIPVSQFDEKINGIASSSGGLNVFTQLEEPATKDGIWIKTKETTKIETEKICNVPEHFYSPSIISVGTNVYSFGSPWGLRTCYKYDTLSDTYTKLNDAPFDSDNDTGVGVGDSIYLFHAGSLYKYNTLANSFTRLATVDTQMSYSAITYIGNYIYLFGSDENNDYSTMAYKYNLSNNQSTRLSSIPYRLIEGIATSMNGNVYLFGGSRYTDGYAQNICRYNVSTNTYDILYNLPEGLVISNTNSKVGVVNSDICLFSNSLIYKYDFVKNELQELAYVGEEISTGAVVNGCMYCLFLYERDSLKVTFNIVPEKQNYEYKKIKLVDSSKNNYVKLADIPYKAISSRSISVDSDIYIFGGQENSSNSTYTNAYKYNTLTGIYTQIKSMPVKLYQCLVMSIGTEIYLIGGIVSSSSKYIYKYDVSTNSYTYILSLPSNFSLYTNLKLNIDTDIYLFGSYGYSQRILKYSTLTNNYTELTSELSFGGINSMILLGTDIHVFKEYNHCRFDTLNNEKIELSKTPFNCNYIKTMKYNNSIYLIDHATENIFKYDAIMDKYQKLNKTHQRIYIDSETSVNVVGDNIYLTAGSGTYVNSNNYCRNNYKYGILPRENKDIIIETDSILLYNVKLQEQFETCFSNSYIYDEDEVKMYPIYYGDGGKWNLI